MHCSKIKKKRLYELDGIKLSGGISKLPLRHFDFCCNLQLVSTPISRTVVPRGSVSADIYDFVGSGTMVSFKQCIPDY